MKHIEYEERVMISVNDYLKVIDDVKNEGVKFTTLLIENIYLDNDSSFIYNNKMMLRIRNINKKDEELTLKIKKEDNTTLEINETRKHHPTIDKYLEGKLEDYKEVSHLVTYRIEVKYKDYLLVIDKNEYHGVTDYDIEVEADSQEKALEVIQNYCLRYNLKYDPKYKSKSHRAISLSKKQKDEVH